MVKSARQPSPERDAPVNEAPRTARPVGRAHHDRTIPDSISDKANLRWAGTFSLLKQTDLPRQFGLQGAGSTGRTTLRTGADLGSLEYGGNRRFTSKHFAKLKRLADIVVSGAGLIALAPMFATIAAIIKLTSPGPVFFSQPRYGRNNKLFQIYKFRTMHVEELDPSGIRQTMENDPRVTPFGGFLRRTSLDEFPQLLNVLVGDMSLVGPRPHVPGMMAGGILYEQLVPEYFARHAIRPGITGLAQIKGYRGSTVDPEQARRRISCDLTYIGHASLTLDAWIFCETIRREFLFGNGN